MENLQGSRFGVMLGNKSIVTNEVHRDIVSPGDVREMEPGDEYLLVTGYPKFRAKKVRYDEEPVFRDRLLPAAEVGDGAGNYPDLPGKVGIEWLGMRASCPPMPRKADPQRPPEDAPTRKRPGTTKEPQAAPRDLPDPPDGAAEPGAPPAETVVPVTRPRRKRILAIKGDGA